MSSARVSRQLSREERDQLTRSTKTAKMYDGTHEMAVKETPTPMQGLSDGNNADGKHPLAQAAQHQINSVLP